MSDLNQFFEHNSNLLFLAPTGWGKTTLLLDLARKTDKSIIYFSPLRALANEFLLRCLEEDLKAFAPSSRKELNAVVLKGIDFKLFVLTPELLTDLAIETLLEDKIIVFDEFHLFYYWGNSFRPLLLEAYQIVTFAALPCLCLTATANEETQLFWKRSCEGYQHQFLVNLGNQQIKKAPRRFFFCPFKSLTFSHLLANHSAESAKGTKLVFCKYRKEAKEACRLFESKGFKALSCVSGEVERFQRELNEAEKVDFIFCTSTLSHGVNLPEIAGLYITYRVGNLDMWLQMAGRAGRRGEDFILVSADKGNRTLGKACVSLFAFLCHYYFHVSAQLLRRTGHAFGRNYHS